MSKFNQKAISLAVQEYEELYVHTPQHTEMFSERPPSETVQKVLNYEHGVAYSLSPSMALYSMVCTMSMHDKAYRSESEQMADLKFLIGRVDPLFVVKLAIYAREKMYLRSVPIVLLVELAKVCKSGDSLISKAVARVIQRPDEITEMLSYYQISNERDGEKKLGKLSNQIKKGIKMVFESGKFNEYQYAKWS